MFTYNASQTEGGGKNYTTYKSSVFHQEFRLIAACVVLHDVSVPAPEDDLLI